MAAQPKPYTEYPPSYFNIVEHFQISSDPLSFPMTARKVQVVRRSLYRFFRSLSLGLETNPKYIESLLNVTRDLMVCISPSSARRDEPAELVIELNPLSDRILFPERFLGNLGQGDTEQGSGSASSTKALPIPNEDDDVIAGLEALRLAGEKRRAQDGATSDNTELAGKKK